MGECGGVQIENQAYPVTVEPLHTVFSPYGNVQKIAVFEKNSSWQVSISLWGLHCSLRVPQTLVKLSGSSSWQCACPK